MSGFERTLIGKQEWPPKKMVIEKVQLSVIDEMIKTLEEQLEEAQKPAPVTQPKTQA